MTDNSKRTSLLLYGVFYGRKFFYDTGPKFNLESECLEFVNSTEQKHFKSNKLACFVYKNLHFYVNTQEVVEGMRC